MQSVNFTRQDPLSIPVAQLLERWPSAAQVFIAYRMACIGCDFSEFHTPLDVAKIYPVHSERFLEHLMQTIEASSSAESAKNST